MLEVLRVDLHIHSCLSPCAEDTMTPPRVVERAREAGLDWFGVADHNAADNLGAFGQAAAAAGIAFSPGLEITTSEEIHLLAFFGDVEEARRMGSLLGEHIAGRNDVRAFGRQLVVDAQGELLGEREELLIGATDLCAAEVVAAVRRLGGLVIASHVDRPSYSIVSQLGFIPPELGLAAAELSPRVADPVASRSWSLRLGGLPVVWFSDAHQIGDVGAAATRLTVRAPTLSELGDALAGRGGRGVARA